jgi:hypothetical protein
MGVNGIVQHLNLFENGVIFPHSLTYNAPLWHLDCHFLFR